MTAETQKEIGDFLATRLPDGFKFAILIDIPVREGVQYHVVSNMEPKMYAVTLSNLVTQLLGQIQFSHGD